ncbi:glycoside hydrolase family 3 protein [Oleiagrimonas citrea]|uniref:Glycoside hydrolase family 3 protein n=1 Tax=Oleiagrimonas citrea TaxID=1665687 RepID=A0A846ZQ36_9GAMM|nr:glycoside hydrolase family 3 protein [Oleiagrimonas citrea]
MSGNLVRSSSACFRASVRLAFAGVLLSLAGAALAKGPQPAPASTVVHPQIWPRVTPALPPDPALEKRIHDLMAHMSLRQKVGQLVMADITTIKPEDLATYPIGSILAGGNSGAYGDEFASPTKWRKLVDAFHRAAMAHAPAGHPAIPVLFGIDAVHGNNNLVGATLFPQNSALGATRDPALVKAIGAATAAETRAVDIDWTFAPTLAVPQNDRWGRTYEGFSQNPSVVAELGAAEVRGLQGDPGSKDFLGAHHVIATAKHFLGDGGTHDGKDQGDTEVSEQVLRDVHGAGYVSTIAAGVQTVMASFSSWNGEKMHGNHGLLTDVLKKRMGFDGLVVGDWNAHGQLEGCTNASCPKAINAGVDVLMTPEDWRALFANTLKQVQNGQISKARLDDAVARVLRVKLRAGAFDRQAADAGKTPLSVIGSPAHRALARRAVRESLVLLKNKGGILPLNPHQRVLVAGDGANSVSKQSGGWTITWQGTGVTPADFPNAQSIWSGLKQQITAAGGHAELAVDGAFKTKPDVAIVVFGENPYAEFQGDRKNFAFDDNRGRDLDLIKKLRGEGIPVVAVFLAGRPLWVNREINASNAFVMAWLPGSEGGGVADVLLRKPDGTVQHDFHGKLSFAWPRTAVQVAQTADDPQYPYGFGLTYEDRDIAGPLPEKSGLVGQQYPTGLYLDHGKAVGKFRLMLTTPAGVPQAVTSVPSQSGDGAVRITGVDYRAQEDARRVMWKKPGGTLALTTQASVDLDRQTSGDVMLVMTLRTDAVPASGTVTLGVTQADGATVGVPFRAALAKLPNKHWMTVALPLKCFREAGAHMGAVTAPFVLSSDAPLDLALSKIELNSHADTVLACPAAAMH